MLNRRIVLALLVVLAGIAVFSNVGSACAASKYKKSVVLTIDDGSSHNTSRVVDILRTHKARATFFVIGSRWSRETTACLTVGEIGCHGWEHSGGHPVSKYSYSFAYHDMKRTIDLIRSKTGQKQVYVRPMGLVKSKNYKRAAKKLGVHIIGGTLFQDWGTGHGNTAARIRARVKNYKLRNGSVIILHESNKPTVAALPRILDDLHKRGFKIITVSQWRHRSK